jgi:hypothetical protein
MKVILSTQTFTLHFRERRYTALLGTKKGGPGEEGEGETHTLPEFHLFSGQSGVGGLLSTFHSSPGGHLSPLTHSSGGGKGKPYLGVPELLC